MFTFLWKFSLTGLAVIGAVVIGLHLWGHVPIEQSTAILWDLFVTVTSWALDTRL